MPSDVKITYNFKALEDLNKDLRKKLVTKVGIIGNKVARDDKSGLTNAEIGARHEFGVLSERLPRRSFLKDPLTIKQDELVKDVGKAAKDNMGKPKGVLKTFKLMGLAAEKIIQEAFETGGFGLWAPLSQRTINEKNSSSILIDTGILRGSITSQVTSNDNE